MSEAELEKERKRIQEASNKLLKEALTLGKKSAGKPAKAK